MPLLTQTLDDHDVGDDPRVVSGYLTVHRRQLPGAPSALPMSPDINHSPIPLFHPLLFTFGLCNMHAGSSSRLIVHVCRCYMYTGHFDFFVWMTGNFSLTRV